MLKKALCLCACLALTFALTACKADVKVYIDSDSSQSQTAQSTEKTESTESVSSDTLSEEQQGEDVINDEDFANPEIEIDFETGSVTVNSQSGNKPQSSSSGKPQSSSSTPQSSSQSQQSSAVQSATSDPNKDTMNGWTPWQ